MLLVVVLQANKRVPLPDVLKPGRIAVSSSRIFITEQPRIHIYSLKDFKLIKTFGKEGEGPREFKYSPWGPPMVVFPFSDRLLINSLNKISIFTQDGEFIKEMKAPAFTVFSPLKNGFVGNPMVPNKNNQSVLAVTIYNSQLEKVKEIHRSDMTVGPGAAFHLPPSSFTHQVYKDKIFVVIGTEGFVIDVFDLEGKKLYRIKKDYTPIPVDKDYENEAMHWFKNESPFRQMIGTMFKVTFKSHFPAIKDMLVDGDKIFVLTHKESNSKREVIVLDLEGKELKRTFLAFPPEEPFFTSVLYFIRNNTLYTLHEDEETEEWELHIEELK
jgi:hypothetical protein